MNLPEKLKKDIREKLTSLVGVTFDKSLFLDDAILKLICDVTGRTGYEVALLVSRKGEIVDVSVGDKTSADLSVESGGDRYSGYRAIHTHPSGNSALSNMDISFLKNKQLDAMCAIGVKDGRPYDAQVGYLAGADVAVVKCHNAEYLNKYGLIEKIFENEKLYRDYIANLRKTDNNRAIIVKVALKEKGDIETDLDELESLSRTAGIDVVGRVSQFRVKPDSRFFIGSGKIDTIKDMIQLNDANMVIFDNELSGSKVSAISNALGVKVIDRSMLILDIFASRARTNEGKLQVELAQLKYSLPRLNAYAESSGRFGGGVGMRGPGETKLELNRRIVEQNIQRKSDELKKLKQQRDINRQNRVVHSIPVVAIVGYTNSGKSTLINRLAKSDVYVKDELFATLDTTTRRVWMGDMGEVLFTDTVGFISNLPHEFIEAFASTLEETRYADLILHVVDISNPNYNKHIIVTNEVLSKLGCTAPVQMVFNKCDRVDAYDEIPDAIYISAMQNTGIDLLKNKIAELLSSK